MRIHQTKGQDFTILVVDDDVDVRSLLEDALSASGYTVKTAGNGEEGLAELRECDVDLVITDIIMPEKDGLDFIHDLRSEYPSVKVVAMTGGIYEFPTISEVDGADHMVKKPFHLNDILALITNLVGEP